MSNARTYLESQIRTASPQRLRKMLIDGAINHANQIKMYRTRGDREAAFSSTERLRLILDELLNGIRGESDIAHQSKSIYGFLIQELTNSKCGTNVTEIDNIIEVLKIEQDTWDFVCQKHPEALEPLESNKPVEIDALGNMSTTQTPQMHKMPVMENSVNLEC